MKKLFLILAAAVVLSSCASRAKNPPENVSPSPVLKSEGITFDGSDWYQTPDNYEPQTIHYNRSRIGDKL